MKIKIRLENPEDHYAVEELTREAFWNGNWEKEPHVHDNHLLVSRLRTCPAFVPELDFVAEIDGKIVGHIIFSKSRIESENGNTYEALTFGPLSVSPEYQGSGIGKALMTHSFAKAKQLGYRAVLIWGHPDYYPRIGFRRCSEFGITTGDGSNYDAFMIYPLYDNAMDGIHGRCFIDPVYENLTAEDVSEFDKKFPPKELHKPAVIDVLLVHLKPEAREAIEKLGFETLNGLTTKSEREIRALHAVDEDTINVIRSVMKKNGIKWGA